MGVHSNDFGVPKGSHGASIFFTDWSCHIMERLPTTTARGSATCGMLLVSIAGIDFAIGRCMSHCDEVAEAD
jgi:hypothetical protein